MPSVLAIFTFVSPHHGRLVAASPFDTDLLSVAVAVAAAAPSAITPQRALPDDLRRSARRSPVSTLPRPLTSPRRGPPSTRSVADLV